MSRLEGLGIFWEQKLSAGNLKIRHDQSDLERSDKDSFQGTIRRCQKCVDSQWSAFTDE